MDGREMIESIRNTYLSHNKVNTLKHVEEVAETAAWLAEIYDLDISKVRLAALLHDISAIMTPQEMYETAKSRNMEIDPAEEKYHFLLHQRISKIIASETFGIDDNEILNAVECHTTLKKNAGMYDKVIFLADKISWDQKDLPPYYDILKSKAAESLDEACYFFIKYQFEGGLLLMPHQWLIEAYKDLETALKTDIRPSGIS